MEIRRVRHAGVLGGLQAIPREVYQVADIDGAGRIAGSHITLPLLKRVLLFVVVITTIESFNVFTPVYQMTKGGPEDSTHTLVYHVFVNGFRYFDMGYATAMSFALVLSSADSSPLSSAC